MFNPEGVPDEIVEEAMKQLDAARESSGGQSGARLVGFETKVLGSAGWTLAMKGHVSPCNPRSLQECFCARLP